MTWVSSLPNFINDIAWSVTRKMVRSYSWSRFFFFTWSIWLRSNCFSFRDVTDATLVNGLEFPEGEADIDTESSGSDDYLPEVCLHVLCTGCYSQPNFIFWILMLSCCRTAQPSRITFFHRNCICLSIVSDFAWFFYTILCMNTGYTCGYNLLYSWHAGSWVSILFWYRG
jgi:hypothetical protein